MNTMIKIHDKIRELLDQEARDNIGRNGYPLDLKLNQLLEDCADYINNLEP